MAMQAQIQALLAVGGETGGAATGLHLEVAKPAIFSREAGKVGVKIIDSRLYFYSPFTLFYFSFLFPF